MSNTIKERIKHVENKITSKELYIANAKENNKNCEIYSRQYKEINELIADIEIHKNQLINILKISKLKDTEYREKRLSYLENYILENLQYIFPDEYLIPKIMTPQKYGVNRTKLVLVDALGMERSTENCAGGLMQQLISYSSAVSVTQLCGCNTFFIDEAFGNSSISNKSLVGNLLKRYIDNGQNVIMITQDPLLYESINRREIHLVKELGETKVEKCFDVEVDNI